MQFVCPPRTMKRLFNKKSARILYVLETTVDDYCYQSKWAFLTVWACFLTTAVCRGAPMLTQGFVRRARLIHRSLRTAGKNTFPLSSCSGRVKAFLSK